MLAFLLEQSGRFSNHPTFAGAVRICLLAGMAGALLSIVTGLSLSRQGGYDPDLLRPHQWLGFALGAVSLLLYGIHRKFLFPRLAGAITSLLWWALAILLVLTGHYGGSLTHGAGYLFAAGREKQGAYTPLSDAFLYEDLIQPILDSKCTGCHGSSKVRGGLRLDSLSLLYKGGTSGPAIVRGQPMQSRLWRYLILPDTAAMHMPPVGHAPLLPFEMALIEWWIHCGAPEKARTGSLKRNERIQPLLEAIEGLPGAGRPDIPNRAIAAAHSDTLADLRKMGIVIYPVAQGSPYLTAHLLHTGDSLGNAIRRLMAVKAQLIWLQAAREDLNDAHLRDIGRLSALTRLDLSHSCISDTGLTALAGLDQLRWVNLGHTPVTDKGLRAITALPRLRALYLYQTGVTPRQASDTRRQFPELELELGGFQTAFYPTDTLEYQYIPPK